MNQANIQIKTISAAVAAACLWMATPVYAQEIGQSAPAAPAEPLQSQTVVTVTGFRQSAENALNIKRNSDGFVDAVSADALGRFPDLNVGEALTRIPGIQINRENGDRQATVNLRGLPSTFAAITLNGMPFADPGLGSATPLGAFSSDVFTAFVVKKSPSAADKAGGLSGIIDLQIQGALARKDGGSVKISDEYNTLGSTHAPGLNLSANRHLSKTLAVYGALTFKRENFRRDTVQPNTFQQLSQGNATFVRSQSVPASGGRPALPAVGTGSAAVTNLAAFADYYRAPLRPGETLLPGEVVLNVPGSNTADGKPIVGTGLKSTTGVQFVNSVRQLIRETKGDLLTFATGAEFKPRQELTLGANVFHTRRQFTGESDTFINDYGRGNEVITADPASLFTTPLGLNYVNSFKFSNGYLISGRRPDDNLNSTTGFTGSLKWRTNAWQAETNLGLSKGRARYSQLVFGTQKDPGLITAANPGGNGVSGSVDMGYGNVHDVNIGYDGPPNAVPGGVLGFGLSPAVLASPAAVAAQNLSLIRGTTGGVLQVGGNVQQTDSRVNTIQQTFERNLDNLPISSIKAGIGYEQNKMKSTAYTPSAYGVNPAGLTSSLIIDNDRAGAFFGGKAPGYVKYWPTIDLDYALANLKPTAASIVPGQPLAPAGYQVMMTPDGWVNNPNDANYSTGNFRNDFGITSAFVMANIETEVLGMPLRGNVGIRHERLRKSIDALERTLVTVGGLPSARYQTRTFESTYNKSLPSLMLALEPRKDLVVRYAAYETYVAPNRRDENPVSSVTQNIATNATTYAITLGKKDLKPYTALSQDVGVEWYNRKGSVLALSLYQKRINGYTYAISGATDPDLACPSSGIFQGQDFGTGPLRPYNPAAPTGQGCRAVNDDPNNLINGAPAPVYVNATGSKNNPSTVTARGLEISAQQNLSFLPKPWSDFGGMANYSLTKVRGTYPNGTKVLMNGVSEGNYNFVGFYETSKFGIRLIYNYREKYDLPGGQTYTGGPRTAKPRRQVDMSATYRFDNGMTLSLDGFNLTDSLREDYDQDPRVLRQSDYDGRTYRVSLRSSF